jgi:hypothetical protein
VAALIVIVALAAGLASGLAVGTSDGAGPARAAGRIASPAAEAAAWVAGQVSHETTVACDPAMCTQLQRLGFPASNLDLIRAGTDRPLDANLVVTTAAMRGPLAREAQGGALAPVTLAGFGTGAGRVVIQPTAPHGPAAYLTGFRADLATRRSVGAQLLLNPNVAADPLARQQLSQGLADSRLIATIAMLAALHPVHLVSFGDAAPGASPGVPLRSVLLFVTAPADVTPGASAGTAPLAPVRALLLAQQSRYRPAAIQTVRLGTGQPALRIMFAAPGPLGLLDASQPLVNIASP